MAPPAFGSHGVPISGDLYFPSTGSKWPSVVVAYGTAGMDPPFDTLIGDFGKDLAASGFLTFIPRYFESTGTSPGFKTVFSPTKAVERFDRWIQVLHDAVEYVQGFSGSATGRSGLVGFSLGALLALKAAEGPKVKAVVDFFGPIAAVGASISQASVGTLPPTLIHHGKLDKVVDPISSDTLAKWLAAKSIAFNYDPNAYPSDGHPGQSQIPEFLANDWSATSQASATKESISFLTRWI